MNAHLLLACFVLGLTGRASAGSFADPTLIPTARHLSDPARVIDGQLALAAEVAELCGHSARSVRSQRKTVLAYHEQGAAGEQVTFTECNSRPFPSALWLLACPSQLADRAGAGALAAGCTCTPAGGAPPACRLIGAGDVDSGAEVTTTTQPGHWYYLVVLTSPGKGSSGSPPRSFSLAARLSAPKPGGCADCPSPPVVRLADGSSRVGRLEIWRESAGNSSMGEWGTVCGTNFTKVEAGVACRELGMPGEALVVPLSALEGSGGGRPIWLEGVRCNGSEPSLRDCRHGGWGRHSCRHSQDVAILCTGGFGGMPQTVRLVGGPNSGEGRLEVAYRGSWGTVCDSGFGRVEAGVACRQLSPRYTGGVAKCCAGYGPGSGPIWLDKVKCTGSESRLEDCRRSKWGKVRCNHKNDVSIKCFPVPLS